MCFSRSALLCGRRHVVAVTMCAFSVTLALAAPSTYRVTERQVHIRYVSRDQVPIGVLHGRGLFTHLAGIGVAVCDVGHLVFNDDTGATLLDSNKVIGFDEPFDFGAEICAALTGSAVK